MELDGQSANANFSCFLYAIKKALLCHIFIVMYYSDYMYFAIK